MPDTVDGERHWTTGPLEELQTNLNYARGLVAGGRNLERDQVDNVEISDLYRAAWVQAVSALDRWVFREIHQRALDLALNAAAKRPSKFLGLQMPIGVFEDLHRHSDSGEKAFFEHLHNHLRYKSSGFPEQTSEGFALVSEKPLWPGVADQLAKEADGELATESAIVECLRYIVKRRDNIAHAADRDPVDGLDKVPLSAEEADSTIDRIWRISDAIRTVLDSTPSRAQLEPVIGRSSRQELYLQFWTDFKPVVERRGWTTAQPQPQNWWNMPAGVSGATWALSFSRFGCRSELFFEHPNPEVNLARWRILKARQADIEARFGDGLIFDDLPQNKGCRIETRLHDVTVHQRDRWADIRNWMEDTQVRLRAAVGAVPSLTA